MWVRSSWRGVTAHKLPEDMWNYQEIISDLQPSIILEVLAALCLVSAEAHHATCVALQPHLEEVIAQLRSADTAMSVKVAYPLSR